MNACWFNLPGGETATELEVTVPVKGRVKAHAAIFAELDRFRDLIHAKEEQQGLSRYAPLDQRLSGVLASYERTAADALQGAKQVRDDVLVYLRSVVFLLQTVTDDHTSHAEKNARLRGVIHVLERQIGTLRDEHFNFSDSCWRRAPDTFRWDGPERRLREQMQTLQGEKAELERRLAEQEGGSPCP